MSLPTRRIELPPLKLPLHFLLELVVRMPQAGLVFVLLALTVIAGCSSYAGILLIGSLADFLHISRFLAGLLLGLLFLRLPTFKDGTLRTRGVLPKPARLPLLLILLAASLADHIVHNELGEAVFIGLAMGILLAMKAIRKLIASRVAGFFTKYKQAGTTVPAQGQGRAADPGVIDVDFREAKD